MQTRTVMREEEDGDKIKRLKKKKEKKNMVIKEEKSDKWRMKLEEGGDKKRSEVKKMKMWIKNQKVKGEWNRRDKTIFCKWPIVE